MLVPLSSMITIWPSLKIYSQRGWILENFVPRKFPNIRYNIMCSCVSLIDITGLLHYSDYQCVHRVLGVGIRGSIVVTHRDQRKSNEGKQSWVNYLFQYYNSTCHRTPVDNKRIQEIRMYKSAHEFILIKTEFRNLIFSTYCL